MKRGEIWWAALDEPRASGPGFRRPVLLVQSDAFNASRIQTVIVAVLSSNMRLAAAPGNVRLPAKRGELPKASVINISQLLTLDKTFLTKQIGKVTPAQLQEIDAGLKLVLSLA